MHAFFNTKTLCMYLYVLIVPVIKHKKEIKNERQDIMQKMLINVTNFLL